jgi:hypothetical protein
VPQVRAQAKSCKWTSSARLRSRTLFAAQVAVCPWRRLRHPALWARRRPRPPARRAGFQSRSRASPESSAHGSRSISHGDANAGACAGDGRVRTRPPTSSRRAADARCALSRSRVQDLTLRDGDPRASGRRRKSACSPLSSRPRIHPIPTRSSGKHERPEGSPSRVGSCRG